ncbi:hypothetical protein D3C71_1858680 [compost metagenome]
MLGNMPELDVAAALGSDLGAGFDEDRLDPKRNRHPLRTFFCGRGQVFSVVEVELIHRREAVEPVRSQDQVECFAECALADIVGAHHQGVPVEQELSRLDAAKIRDGQPDNLHVVSRIGVSLSLIVWWSS